MTTQLHSVLLSHLMGLFAPLTSVRDAEDLRHRLDAIGWDLDALAGADVASTVEAARALAQAASKVAETATTGTGSLSDYLPAAAALADAATRVVRSLADWSPPQGLDADNLALLGEDLLGGLIDAYLALAMPRGVAVLELLGVVRREPAPELALADGTVVRRAMDRPAIDGIALRRAVTDPLGLLADRFLNDPAGARRAAEGIADFVGPQLAEATAPLGVVASYGVPEQGRGLGLTPDELDAARHLLLFEYAAGTGDSGTGQPAVGTVLRLVVGFTDDTAGRGLGLVLAPVGELDVTAGPVEVRLVGEPSPVLVTGAGVDFSGGVGASRLALTVTYAPPATEGGPVARFGTAEGTRFEIGRIRASLTGELTGEAADLGVAIELHGVVLAVAGEDGDGFLQQVLAAIAVRATTDLSASWSPRAGLQVSGSGNLELRVPVGTVLGPVTIDELVLSLGLGDDGLLIRGALSATLALGPFVVTVAGVGLRSALALSPSTDSASPLAIGFQPPNGLGLAIETPAVSGGGFLEFNPDAGRYTGVFELTIVEVVSVKVIGIITTKLPGGRPGFALLLIITAEGFTPVQLGMGFVLTGIGGLLALNRTIDVDAVRGGLSSGILDSVLFAKDPVANAPRIIATLDRIFPQAPDRLLIGPLAEIGWGSPPVVKLRLALLLEIPQPLRAVLLAALAIVLPDEDQPVVELHVDAVGVLDLARGELALDASLHHSRLWKFALTGDMALRLNWGSDPQFLISVGGFHPRFPPPAGLRRLDRLTFSLSDSENPRVRLETYLAVTSNTIQMGARVSLRAEAGGFGIDGGGAFDALVQWVPFGIDVGFEAWVRVFGPTGTLLAARVAVQITGPQPWHVAGVASVQLLWFSIQVNVDFTIGDPQPPPALETVDVAGLLWRELARPASWSAALAAGVRAGVTLSTASDRPDEQVLVVHPLATVSVRQKVAPLGTTVSRVGAVRPRDGTRRYELDAQAPAGIGVRVQTDHFAVAQYQDLSDDDKLRRPSFSRLPGGVSLVPEAATAVPLQRAVSVDLGFETLDLAAFDAAAVPAGGEPTPAAPALLGRDVEQLLPRQRAGLQVVPA
jgi:hypothetical protein